MREIDSDALLGVEKYLRIASPSTAGGLASYDDEVVSQVLDVGQIMRPRGFWAEDRVQLAAGAGGLNRAERSLSDFFALPYVVRALSALGFGSRYDVDTWLIRATPYAELNAISNLTEIGAGLQNVGEGWIITSELEALCWGDTAAGVTQVNDAVGTEMIRLINKIVSPCPLKVPNDTLGDSTVHAVLNAQGGAAAIEGEVRLMWFCIQKGVPVRFAI